jgi:hypothetical protein
MTRSSGSTATRRPSSSYSRARAIEGVEPGCGQDHINPIQPCSPDRGRLQPHPGRVEAAGPARGLVESGGVDPVEPYVEILRRHGRAFEECRTHPDDQEADAKFAAPRAARSAGVRTMSDTGRVE